MSTRSSPGYSGNSATPTAQPIGLVAVIAADWRIAAVSNNVADFLALAPGEMLGRQVAAVFHPDALHALRNRMALIGSSDGAERLFHLPLVEGGTAFDLLVQVVDGSALIDVLPAADPEGLDVAALVERTARRCAPLVGVQSLAEEAARCVRAMMGFDQIAIWRCDGELIASCKRARAAISPNGAPPPVCDRTQAVADVEAVRCAMLFDDSRLTVNLGRSLLASQSGELERHVKSAGARAGLVVPLMVGDRQWGMISACHGYPRMAGLARLSGLELFARVLALEIAARERAS